MPTVSTPAAVLHCIDKGPATAPAVVLLHGFPVHAGMWAAQLDALSDTHRVIALDARGFGGSPRTGPYSIDTLADDVHALQRELNLGRFALAGLSMGGYVALAYASKYAQDLRGLVLVDTKPEADNAEAKETRTKSAQTARQQGAKPIADTMLPKLIGQTTANTRPQVVAALRQMMEAADPEAIALAQEAMRDRPDRTAMLGSIAVPTLVVCGDADTITPPDLMRKMHQAIPNSRFELIPQSGHMTPMEQPEAVTRAMEAFLGTL